MFMHGWVRGMVLNSIFNNITLSQYEEKVVQLQVKIKSIEMERDTILSNIGKAFIYSPNSQR
jgi:hypothetical protein